MGLDRGVLSRIDRKLLARLGDDEAFHPLRVPATGAMWSTWRRYCDASGISMGRAIAMLIGHELAGVVDDTRQPGGPVVSERAGEEAARRKAEIARREEELKLVEDRLRAWGEHLRRRERELEAREGRDTSPAGSPIPPERSWDRVGRNEPCPCGSGRKYKRCHGTPTSRRRDAAGTDGSRG